MRDIHVSPLEPLLKLLRQEKCLRISPLSKMVFLHSETLKTIKLFGARVGNRWKTKHSLAQSPAFLIQIKRTCVTMLDDPSAGLFSLKKPIKTQAAI